MGGKKKTIQNNSKLDGRVYIKFVKRANMWCKTTFENGKQKQEWYDEPRK